MEQGLRIRVWHREWFGDSILSGRSAEVSGAGRGQASARYEAMYVVRSLLRAVDTQDTASQLLDVIISLISHDTHARAVRRL